MLQERNRYWNKTKDCYISLWLQTNLHVFCYYSNLLQNLSVQHTHAHVCVYTYAYAHVYNLADTFAFARSVFHTQAKFQLLLTPGYDSFHA